MGAPGLVRREREIASGGSSGSGEEREIASGGSSGSGEEREIASGGSSGSGEEREILPQVGAPGLERDREPQVGAPGLVRRERDCLRWELRPHNCFHPHPLCISQGSGVMPERLG